MSALPLHTRHRRCFLVAVLFMSGLSELAASSMATTASASTVIPTCSYSQLEVAVANDSGAYHAAGNEGIPFLIANRSNSACSLKGYPRLRVYPSTYKKSTVKVVNGGGMIFVTVKPRLVVLRPGATASFGLDYGDAYDQQDPNRALCTTQNMYVSLPVRSHPYSQAFNTTANLNFCFAGFKFDVTSIQSGPVPREG